MRWNMKLCALNFAINPIIKTRGADQGEVHLVPDPTVKKKPNPDPNLEKPDQT